MSTLTVATVKSNSSSPPAFQNTSGTEIGRLCRAFVNFDGTGTVSIRASYNVSSITDNGVGTWTVNLTAAMSDANYTVVTSAGWASLVNVLGSYTSSTVPIVTGYFTNFAGNASGGDNSQVYVAIFR